jgi:methionine synthase II (cobalamin-independent)
MAEQTTLSGTGTSSGAGTSGGASSDTLKSFSEQATAAAREYKNKASDLAGSSADRLKEQASGLTDAARDMADQATDKIKEAVSDKKAAGADYVSSLAETIRRAGREFDDDLPIAGKYIRKAASQVDNVADSIRTGDFNDLVRNAQSFARRQPTAFLGIAALTGFAVVRFLKSSWDMPTGASVNPASRQNQASQTGYRDEFSR